MCYRYGKLGRSLGFAGFVSIVLCLLQYLLVIESESDSTPVSTVSPQSSLDFAAANWCMGLVGVLSFAFWWYVRRDQRHLHL